MIPLLMGGIVDAVSKIADDLITSDTEKAKAGIEAYQAETARMDGQIEINKIEAGNSNTFVSGWRPAIGWIGAAAMAYEFLGYPALTWGWRFLQAKGYVPADLSPPPHVDTDALWVILTGILGLGTARTFEKVKGVSR